MNAKLKKIKAIVMDVDGVMTDGRVIIGDDFDIAVFDARDGFGINAAKQAGLIMAIITGRNSKAVLRRVTQLGFDEICQGSEWKLADYESLRAKHDLLDEEIAYMGDDIPDIPTIRKAGFGVAVRNACAEVRDAADYVTACGGGRGAVREVIEMILKAQGKWAKIVEKFSNPNSA